MTETITITEGLAEIKTIGKRLEKKRRFIADNLARQDGAKDPLERGGGAPLVIAQERQAMTDLEERIVKIRRAIQAANDATLISVCGIKRTISEWLTWRRDVAPGRAAWLSGVREGIKQIREVARQKGRAVVSAVATTADTKPEDLIVNVDEREIAAEIEKIEEILGTLDGQLSLKNATVFITI